MNRVQIPFNVVKMFEDLPKSVKEQILAKLQQLQGQHDPLEGSVRVPFKEFDDVRMVQVGDYVLFFKFDAKKSELYPLTISKM